MADPAPPPSAPPPPTLGEEFARFAGWCGRHPIPALLLAALAGTLVYFYAFQGIFNKGTQTTLRWAYESWNTENDLEHGALILPAAIVVAWMHRRRFAEVKKQSSWAGLLAVAFGILLFVVAAWTLQQRVAIVALPVLIFGCVWFLWGWPVAREAAFPCAFLLFMVPIGFLLGHTEPLQRLVASIVAGLTNLAGIGVERVGVKLLATDGSFQCEVAGGCSGVRSLMAMAMLSALYGHFTFTQTWKKIAVFCVALPCAVLGNIGRVFSIMLTSKIFGGGFGTGAWHDISGFIVTIPIAVCAMIGFANLLQRDWRATAIALMKPDPAPAEKPGDEPAAQPSPEQPPRSPISYDY